MGIVNLATALRAAQLSSVYAALEVSFPPVVQAVAAAGWGVGFLWGAWRLWRLRNGSRRWVLVLVGTYGLFQVAWWRAFARSDYALGRWPWATLVTTLVVAFIFWYLNRPPVRALFRAQASARCLTKQSSTDPTET